MNGGQKVTVFNPSDYGISKGKSAEFISSNNEKGFGKKLKSKQGNVEEDGIKAIYDRLQSLEEFDESNMDGRTRRKAYHAKLIELGAKAPKAVQTSYRISKGIQKKRKENEKKSKLAAQEQGFLATSSFIQQQQSRKKSYGKQI